MAKYLDFRKDKELGTILLSWWNRLDNNRGDRAALRRCTTPAEVVMVPAYHELLMQLRNKDYSVNSESLLRVAGLLAHVKEHMPAQNLARQMGEKSGDRPRVSDLRFRRLIAIKDPEEMFTAMLRIIRLLAGRVDVVDLAHSVYRWNDYTRKDWAYTYYGSSLK